MRLYLTALFNNKNKLIVPYTIHLIVKIVRYMILTASPLGFFFFFLAREKSMSSSTTASSACSVLFSSASLVSSKISA